MKDKDSKKLEHGGRRKRRSAGCAVKKTLSDETEVPLTARSK
jgi:hypothetical protein